MEINGSGKLLLVYGTKVQHKNTLTHSKSNYMTQTAILYKFYNIIISKKGILFKRYLISELIGGLA